MFVVLEGLYVTPDAAYNIVLYSEVGIEMKWDSQHLCDAGQMVVDHRVEVWSCKLYLVHYNTTLIPLKLGDTV